MSYILDALRKSERERAVGNIPTLATPYPRGVPPSRLWAWVLLAAALILAAAAGGYMMWQRGADDAPASSSATAPVAAVPTPGPVPTAAVRNAPAAVAAASRPAPAATSPAPQQAPVEEPIPGLTVNVVAYSEEPARRFVMINLKSYKEGERTAEGAVVEEIQPDGAVVSYKGRRVRLHP